MRSLRNHLDSPALAARAVSVRQCRSGLRCSARLLRGSEDSNNSALSQPGSPASQPRPDNLKFHTKSVRRFRWPRGWPCAARRSSLSATGLLQGWRWHRPSLVALRVAIPGSAARGCPLGWLQAVPNPSFKPSPNGRPPGRRYSAGLHCLKRRPGVLPSVPA